MSRTNSTHTIATAPTHVKAQKLLLLKAKKRAEEEAKRKLEEICWLCGHLPWRVHILFSCSQGQDLARRRETICHAALQQRSLKNRLNWNHGTVPPKEPWQVYQYTTIFFLKNYIYIYRSLTKPLQGSARCLVEREYI